jgi:hypothetical protein
MYYANQPRSIYLLVTYMTVYRVILHGVTQYLRKIRYGVTETPINRTIDAMTNNDNRSDDVQANGLTTQSVGTTMNQNTMVLKIVILLIALVVLGLCVWKWALVLKVLTWPYKLVTAHMAVSTEIVTMSGGILGKMLSVFGLSYAPVMVVTEVATTWSAVLCGLLAELLYLTCGGTVVGYMVRGFNSLFRDETSS